MSELVNARENRTSFRFQLLATVSAIALLTCAYNGGEAKAADDDSDRPPLWIELGGQLSRLGDGQETFSPPLMDARPSIFSSSRAFERPPLYSIDETGKISFEPDGSDWIVSASVRYGRSGSNRHVRQQTNPATLTVGIFRIFPTAARFADTSAQNDEHHLILDFMAGKDVGLGMFGDKDGSSVLSAGIRFAQFSTKSNIALKSDPDWHPKYIDGFLLPEYDPFHSNAANMTANRSFHGVGPALSWNASAPVIGNAKDSELTFDFGLNAAILFGRQRAKVHHQTTGRYHHVGNRYQGLRVVTYYPTPVNLTRAKAVTVPNVGGFAGVSFVYSNAKVSFGYRGDFFFCAVDGGIDNTRKENVGFYGPFVSVSVGIGG
jgi:iron complex outermembrane receptor protein